MPDSARYGLTEDGALLDVEKLLEWDPQTGAWFDYGRYLGSFLESTVISEEEAARIILAAKPSRYNGKCVRSQDWNRRLRQS